MFTGWKSRFDHLHHQNLNRKQTSIPDWPGLRVEDRPRGEVWVSVYNSETKRLFSMEEVSFCFFQIAQLQLSQGTVILKENLSCEHHLVIVGRRTPFNRKRPPVEPWSCFKLLPTQKPHTVASQYKNQWTQEEASCEECICHHLLCLWKTV